MPRDITVGGYVPAWRRLSPLRRHLKATEWVIFEHILECIETRNQTFVIITRDQFGEALGMSEKTADRNISKMVAKGVILQQNSEKLFQGKYPIMEYAINWPCVEALVSPLPSTREGEYYMLPKCWFREACYTQYYPNLNLTLSNGDVLRLPRDGRMAIEHLVKQTAEIDISAHEMEAINRAADEVVGGRFLAYCADQLKHLFDRKRSETIWQVGWYITFFREQCEHFRILPVHSEKRRWAKAEIKPYAKIKVNRSHLFGHPIFYGLEAEQAAYERYLEGDWDGPPPRNPHFAYSGEADQQFAIDGDHYTG